MSTSDQFRLPLILKYYRKFQLSLSPQQNLLFGFLSYSLIGWLFLCTPWAQTTATSWIDNLFVAVSAISTTGLSTVSIADNYSYFGEFIVLLLIQIGGVGYMTFTSFVLLARKNDLTHWHQRVLNAEFALPRGFQIHDFLRSVILFTLLVEAIGAILFFIAFIQVGIPAEHALWSSIFHSVSSFCTAGFSLYNNSFEGYAGHFGLNMLITVLSILGSVGFIVVTDVWQQIRKKSKSITYTSRVILNVTGLLIFIGTLWIYFFEPSLQNHQHRLLISFFQSMSALTTVGYNSYSIGVLSQSVLLVLIFLMFVGASPSGTGGGLKTTTLTALTAFIWSQIRNQKEISFFGKKIPQERLKVANAAFLLYAFLLFFATFLLSAFEEIPMHQLFFEATSAIGTVGLSMGITAQLSSYGKLILVLIMFAGRLGLLTLGIAMMAQRGSTEQVKKEVDLAL